MHKITGQNNHHKPPAAPSGEVLELIFSDIPTGIAYLDLDFNIIWANQGYAQAAGWDVDEIRGRNYFDLFPDQKLKPVFRQITEKGGSYSSFNSSALGTGRANEETFWDWRLQALHGADQSIRGLVITLEDVTQRAKTEIALQKTQQLFEHVFESDPDANLLVDESGKIQAANKQAENLFGYSRKELAGKPIEILLPQHLRKNHVRDRQEYQADPHVRSMGAGLDLYAQRKDGTQFPVDITLSPLKMDHELLVLAVVRDITLRKKAEEALKKSEERFRNSVENLLESFAILTARRSKNGAIVDFVVEYANEVARRGESQGFQMVGRSLSDLLPRIKGTPLFAGLRRVVKTGEPLSLEGIDYEDRWEGKFPFARSIDIQATRLGDGVAMSWRDVTEDKRMAAVVRQQEALLRTVVDTLPVGVWAFDKKGEIILGNQVGLQIWGGPLPRRINQPGGPRVWWRKTGQPVNPQEWPISGALSRGEASLEEEIEFESPEGELKTILSSTVPLKSETGQVTGAVMVSQEITERIRMEAELAEVQRRLMDGIELERRRLAQELHDGPIQDLYGISFQLQSLEEEHLSQAGLSGIRDAQGAVQAVVQVLRDLCGELRPPTLVHFGLRRAITGHIEKFQASHPEIKVDLNLADDGKALPEPIRMALYRIYQHAISNIARHANASQIEIGFDMENQQAMLEIRDNGVGFEVPRRWVKLAREGHLGLVGSAERAESAGGKLEVESRPGGGTTIRVVVPLPSDSNITAVPKAETA